MKHIDGYVCVVCRGRLFAAAPDLLAALKAILEHVEDRDIERGSDQCTLCYTFRMKGHAASAKAKGEA